jgi:uncharacterized coiled-coil DUF342 family protein
MSIVHSVSDITSILSGIIQNEPDLQNVWVTGEVSVDRWGVFFLIHEGKKIRCFIPGGNIAMFRPLLVSGNKVAVNGKITLYVPNSDYQISVKDCQEIDFNSEGNNRPLTVSEITNRLLEIIGNSSELQEIEVQGKILNFASTPAANLWNLSDTNNRVPVGNAVQKIHCFSNPNLINDVISVDDGDEVQIQGAIHIFGPSSRYQIIIRQIEKVTQIESTPPVTRCQCSGCTQCDGTTHCDRHRKIANFESCATCLPHPPDELYKLCPECYAVSPDHETKVAEAVYTYFNELQVNGFSPDKECQIQFGTRNGIADVVLVDGNRSFAVIAECKGAEYVGHGIEQLKSYLSATDARFGIFANSTDPDSWVFYENLRHNRLQQIGRSEFEEGVAEGVATRDRLSDEIEVLESKFNQLRGEIDTLKSKNVGIETEVRQESQKLDVLKQAIESNRADKQDLSNEIDRLRTDKTKLKTEIGKLERKESELQTSRKQWKEKIQQFETFLADLKSDLLDSEMLPQSEENADSQKASGQKKQSIMSKLKTIKLKNPFSKENK